MKSPIKANPLRNPGESLDKELSDVLYDEALSYYVAATISVVIAGYEWWRLYAQSPPRPWPLTILALVVVSVAGWKIRKAWKKAKNIKLGLKGEKAVGQFLDELRSKGAQILHDIPGDNFNIDHVVIHTSGIYVIETKTWSKPDRGEVKLIFDGQRILKNGKEPERNPIVQVLAGSKWIAELIKESTGKTFSTRPVVLFPGWYIQPTAEAKNSEVWVLNPKALPTFISNSKQTLSSEDAQLCYFHLKRFVRSSE